MLEKHLEILEDNTFTHSLSRNQHLEGVLNALDKGDSVSVTVLERILTICGRDLKEDAKHAVFCLNIISKILNKYQSELPTSKLVSSAETVFNFTLTAASLNRAESLQTISFNTLLTYPDHVLAEWASTCTDVYELFNLYCHMKMPVEIRFKPIYLAHKAMNKLSPDKKAAFVQKGLAVWFSKVIPCAMNSFQTQIISTSPMILTLIELLEMLTEQLATIDYTTDPQWQIVLENIYSPNAYPAQMKNLLTSGSVLWHKIWIIFIKLLKAQITMNKPGVGSPINSMLPVVEMAFKMDVKSRCRAFQCWNVLIDNFSSETNELFVNKRIKLLIIPLRSNNAKVEETALAKLDTWWHLIKQYETRVDDRMLYPFLHFCFGRHVPEKTTLIPGTISPVVKKSCVEAFVEMVGHVNCEGCVSKPRLKNKLISTKVLVDHWSDWTHSLKMAIKASAEDDVGIGEKPITCAWKSFVMTIAEMQENNIRKDLINDLLTITKLLAQESTSNNKLADIVNNVLISSILGDTSLKLLLKTTEFQNGPIQRIISILIDPIYAETCEKHSNQNLMVNLKLITENIVTESKLAEKAIKWLIKDVTPNDSSLQLWTALAEALQVSQTRHEYLQQMCNMLLWPLLNLHNFNKIDTAALTWNSTYCVMHLTTVQTVWFHMEINRILLENQNKGPTATFFVLCVLLAVIKTKINTNTFEGLNKAVKLLQDVMCKYNDYDEVSLVFPILIDTMDLLTTAAVNTENVHNIFLIGKKVLNILNKHLERGGTTEEVIIVKMMDAFEVLFKTDSGKEFKVLVLEELLQCRSFITTSPVPSSLDCMLKSVMADKNIDQSIREKVKAAFGTCEDRRKNDLECLKKNVSKTKDQDENEFTTPVTKNAKKGPKKKETSIVNTVVENGEEFAVIKSNWKFNPRKLTENQKEKFQRKREDIPALYQDLSQSQDEFKLKSWKTDSQDASTTNSRSANTPSTDNISTLKNMPGTDIVPKIIDNFFSDTPKDPTEKNQKKETDSPKSKNIDQAKSSPSVKTPRMALKDRVFRNVRNLIEKSTVSKEGPQNHQPILNQTVTANLFNTPDTKCKETQNVVNSAPSKINADRPARVKRKPKKFDDSELFLLKKRRSSQNDSQSFDMDASAEVTSLPQKDNEDVNKNLKVATVLVQSIEVDTSEPRNSNTPITEHGSVNDVKNIDGGENKTVVAEVSTPSVEKTVDQNTKPSYSHKENLEDTDKCSQNVTTVDKSLEEIQQSEQRKEASGRNTSTPNQITKRKDSDEIKSTTKKKSRIEKELAIDMVEGHPLNDASADKSQEEIQQSEQKNETSSEQRKKASDGNTSIPNQITKRKDSDEIKSSTKKKSRIEKELAIDMVEGHPLNGTSVDKSLEEIQQSEQKNETSGGNTSTPNHITKRKDSDEIKSITKKKSRIEKELAIDMVEGHPLNGTSVHKSLEEIQQSEQRKEISGGNTSTPNQITRRKDSDEIKTTTKKKSRIEKELAIDMVEGHPFLKLQSDKRMTRKCLTNTPNSTRKNKLNKSKTEPKSASKPKKVTSDSDLPKEKTRKNFKDIDKSSITESEIQDTSPDATQDLSEDVIESSQDTTTTISVKSFRSCVNKPSGSAESIDKNALETQDLVDKSTQEINSTADVVICEENKDDSELPANKTEVQENVVMDLTEEMDTEPTSSGDVIIINDDEPIIDLNTNSEPCPGPDTLELANADTQPTDPSQFVNNTKELIETGHYDIPDKTNEQIESKIEESQLTSTADDRTITLVDLSQDEETGASSPTKDDDQRKKDFLNNTSEISPIKSLSPIEPNSPPSETSNDFLVIKLSGPVQINGEPLEGSNSPEIFTEEKISPDKRDQSPPRPEVIVTNNSPSTSLSLKKNRPQVRSGGRAAQMLGLCVPDRLQTIKHVDRPDTEEPKKSSPVNTPVRRNLRMLYQTAVDSDNSDEKEESANFLLFKKTLPTPDCSPAGPILKRKLADIADEATVSPANKRKRVSFHDPVSTSVSVQKYIETCGVRSPQNSALKRLERQLRHQSPMRSPKRLESLFKLDSVLTKAIESFNENDVTSSNDTELSSLDQTPAVEVVKTSELNDTDPIFPDLIDCKDSIDNIASELSSPAMRLLLVKELEGKIETVGDLAKLTELEVNRICIKAPKVQVAKKVLASYAARKDKAMEVDTVVVPPVTEVPPVSEVPPVTVVPPVVTNSVSVQTNILMSETETQTSVILQRLTSTQTDEFMTLQSSTQTDESGSKSTEDIIISCLKDRKDFVQKLGERLENVSKLKLAEALPVKDCTDLLLKKMTSFDAKSVFNSVIQRECELYSNGLNGNKELSFVQNYLCDKFDVKDLVLFCSQLMKKMYDKAS